VRPVKLGRMTAQMPHLRPDARDNRERILAVARDAFAADGLDVPMREIARRAGVGPATLYRRFPAKEALVAAAFEEQLAACLRVVDEAAARPDPGDGFRHLVERLFEIHALDGGFTAAFLDAYPGAVDMPAARVRALGAVSGLIGRARAAGRLRQDFTLHDFSLILRAIGGLRESSRAAALASSRLLAPLRRTDARGTDRLTASF
jgi:AcrR family transcriptional regulator